MKYALNIEQSKKVLEAFPNVRITRADGIAAFEPSVMRALGLTTYIISQSAIEHLVRKGLVKFHSATRYAGTWVKA